MFLFDDDDWIGWAGGQLLPVITVTNGLITPFARGGVDYIEVLFNQSGRIEVSTEVNWANLALAGGGATGGRGSGTVYVQGGGGAGRLLRSLGQPLLPGAYAVTIGAGAPATSSNNGQTNGSASSLAGPLNWQAPGGGRGGSSGSGYADAAAGGSGGGGRGGSNVAAVGAAVAGTGNAGDGFSGGSGFASSDTTLSSSGGGGGAGGAGGNGASGVAGSGGPGILLDWIATPATVCAGGTGMVNADTTATPGQVLGSGSKGANSTTVGKGGDGFLFLVVRADQVNVRMAA